MAKQFETKDSGDREGFDGGAVRDTQENKPRYDLIPPRPLERLAMLYARGAEKYDEHNWTKGIPVSRCIASLMRHVFQFIKGDTDEDHGAAIIFNVMCMMHYEEVGRTDLDDSFDWQTGKRRNEKHKNHEKQHSIDFGFELNRMRQETTQNQEDD